MRGDERGAGPSRLGDILPSALRAVGGGLGAVWLEARVRKAWTEAVGERVAAHAWVRRVRAGTLEVGVDGDAWSTELRYLGTVLAERINAVLGESVVREVSVRKGPRGG